MKFNGYHTNFDIFNHRLLWYLQRNNLIYQRNVFLSSNKYFAVFKQILISLNGEGMQARKAAAAIYIVCFLRQILWHLQTNNLISKIYICIFKQILWYLQTNTDISKRREGMQQERQRQRYILCASCTLLSRYPLILRWPTIQIQNIQIF